MVTNLPEMVKSETDGEATSRSTCRTIRGSEGRRARKEQSGTWEARCRVECQAEQPRWSAVVLSSRVRQKGRERDCEGQHAGGPLTRDTDGEESITHCSAAVGSRSGS